MKGYGFFYYSIAKSKICQILCLFLLLTFSFCGEDDNFTEPDIIQKDAKKEDLVGIWSIYKVEINGKEAQVPVNFEECGRDFFTYNESGKYNEFIYQENTTCVPIQNKLNWTLDNGIIKLTSENSSDNQIIKIKNVSKDNFVFIADLDIDGDAVKEKFTFTAYRYIPPNEVDIYTSTFQRKEEPPFSNHIEFRWDAYKGYNNFVKYEIYRSGKDCNLNSATLIKTIENASLNNFIDNNPIREGEACYFLKIYTNKGLLAQSEPRYVNPEFILPSNVIFNNVDLIGNEISLSWEKYMGYYFSHYEIKVQDQNKNSNSHIESVKIITDVNITEFLDKSPPYVNNPVYSIFVHNIFGNVSNLNNAKSVVETNFTRPEILDLEYIKYLNFDAESSSFYIYGRNSANETKLFKYDCLTNKVIKEAFKLPVSYTEVEMKLINSEYGKELIFPQSNQLWAYDAETFNYKYALDTDFLSINSFNYLRNNVWILTDNDNVYTFKRDEKSFTLIDKKLHFTDHQGSGNYDITKIDENSILVSHNNEGRAIHYSIDNQGNITNKGVKEIPLNFKLNSDVIVNQNNSYILNKNRNTLYDSNDFTKVLTFTNPLVISNFNYSGTKIYGTNNKPGISNFDQSYKKEVIIYNLQNNEINTFSSKGYPLFISQDKKGNIISLSSGFPRDSYNETHTDNEPDFFVEIIK